MSSSPISSPPQRPLADTTEAAPENRTDAVSERERKTPRTPVQRPRRLRRTRVLRRMVRETVLTVDDLIYPLFVMEGSGQQEEVPSMPGCFRYSLDLFLDEVKAARDLGIGAIALFPLIRHDQKDNAGTESYNVAAYNVSGEYAMVKAAAQQGWI